MKTVGVSQIHSCQILKNHRTETALSVFYQGKRVNKRRDFYTRSDLSGMKYSLYEKNSVGISNGSKGQYTQDILDYINFHFDDICRQKGDKHDVLIINGKIYNKNNIPRIDPTMCNEIRAKDGVVSFDAGNYYRYTDKTGYTHVFTCTEDYLGQPQTELSAHRQNENTHIIGKFWRMLAQNGTYIDLYFSREDQIKYLNDADITNGFFKVQIGSCKQEYYLSNGRKGGPIVAKKNYDAYYQHLMSPGIKLINYYFSPGDTVRIGEKEYIMKDDYSLDIPYGEDIWGIEYPDHPVNDIVVENSSLRLQRIVE
ncbi:MAG: hypothetical protein IKO16_03640 [Lachnospiraceae bacterium]|nr:hypothetical protein [Lachnospiraceae bacterium]